MKIANVIEYPLKEKTLNLVLKIKIIKYKKII